MYHETDNKRRCRDCRWCTLGMTGNECRYFDRDRDRAEWDATAERCPFFENRAAASQVGRICDAIYTLAEAVEKLQQQEGGGAA